MSEPLDAPEDPPSMAPDATPSVVAGGRAATLPRRARGLLLVTHPVPSLLYVLAVGAFSLVAAWSAHRDIAPITLARVLLAIACTQIAIGALNDYRDRALDAVAKPTKPIPRGLIAPRDALVLVWGASALMLALALPLGLVAFALVVLIEALGLAYDLGFKGTWVSGLLFAVYFPLIPLLAWAVFGRWQPFLAWVLPLGAALGIAMNIANSLPDLEADRAAGVRGLPHLLGPRRGLAVAWGIPPLCAVLLWLLDLTGFVPARPAGLIVAALAAIGTTALAALRFAREPSPHTLRGNFFLQAFGVVVLAAAWLAGAAL